MNGNSSGANELYWLPCLASWKNWQHTFKYPLMHTHIQKQKSSMRSEKSNCNEYLKWEESISLPNSSLFYLIIVISIPVLFI